MASLIAACIVFVGSHFVLSHPLRASLVARLGVGPFRGLYSLVAFVELAWIIVAFRAVPLQPLLWTPPQWAWAVGAVVMLFASVLLVGSLIGNPALPGVKVKDWAPRGVFAITRHPMMWSFALWAIVHGALWSTPATLVLTSTMAFLALAGAAGQDAKKARLMGAKWKGWVARTSFVPFMRGPLPAAWPGTIPLAGGALLWLIATWAHGPLAGLALGVWQ